VAKTKLHPSRTDGAHGTAVLADPTVSSGVDRLMAVIDDAVASLSTRGERQLVRDGVAAVVRETLIELADEQAAAAASRELASSRALGDAVNVGVNAAKQVQNLGFVEFTTGLINGTFDAIIAATMKQMDAYAKLVADLSKTLAQFQAENVSDAQVNAHLAERYPDGQGGTVVRGDYTFADTPATDTADAKTANQKYQEVIEALIAETATLKPPAKLLTRAADSLNVDAADTSAKKFSGEQVAVVRTAMGAALATSMMEHLRAMAREGMARIVITSGEILSKLTFDVTATDIQTRQEAEYSRMNAGAYIHGRAGFLFGRVSAGAYWNTMKVRTVNESSFDSVTMSAEIIGQVRINFKTETFPPVVTSG
jgi:hypothetical protein